MLGLVGKEQGNTTNPHSIVVSFENLASASGGNEEKIWYTPHNIDLAGIWLQHSELSSPCAL